MGEGSKVTCWIWHCGFRSEWPHRLCFRGRTRLDIRRKQGKVRCGHSPVHTQWCPVPCLCPARSSQPCSQSSKRVMLSFLDRSSTYIHLECACIQLRRARGPLKSIYHASSVLVAHRWSRPTRQRITDAAMMQRAFITTSDRSSHTKAKSKKVSCERAVACRSQS